MVSPAIADAAEFQVTCTDVPGGELSIFWTDSTTRVGDFDGSGSPFHLVAIDNSSVTLKNDLGTEVIFKGNQLVYMGMIESSNCDLTILSTITNSNETTSIKDLRERIDELERRVTDLESN